MYRAVAVDLDKTLLRSDCSISHRTERVLRRLAERGIPVVVCTGRSRREAAYALGDIPCCRWMVLLTGAQIYDRETGAVLYQQTLPAAEAGALTELLSGEDGVFFQVYSGDRLYIAPKAKNTIWQTGLPVDDIQMTLEESVELDDLPERLSSGTLSCEKIFAIAVRPEKAENIKKAVKKICQAEIVNSFHGSVEIMPRGTSKGEGLTRVLKLLSIPAGAVLAFGDSENDLSMLRMAGAPVAMSNGDACVKSAARIIAPSNDEDGVAVILEKMLKENMLCG